MLIKILSIFSGICFLGFTGFSQETEESLHPKLDKYYKINDPPPPPATKTSTTIILTNGPSASSLPATVGTINGVNAPQSTVPVPVEAKSELPEAGPQSEPVPETVIVVSPPPPPPARPTVAPSQPSDNALYGENRLGSSTPQYGTYKTNSNGTGSVTTTPK